MKFDLQIDSNEDLEHFQTVFFRSMDAEKVLYNFHLNDIMVRVQTAGYGWYQNNTISFFSVVKEGKSTSVVQFNPITDDRFRDSEVIAGVWKMSPNEVSGSFSHQQGGEEEAFAIIAKVLLVVYKFFNPETTPVT